MRSIPLHAANPGPFTGSGNWTYLIPGPVPVLIDAGVGEAAHLDELASVAPDGPADVLVTHAHTDHATGVPSIRDRWPAARFFKHPWPDRDREIDVPWHTLEDGARIPTAEGDLEALHTPGHAPDHMAFWHAESRTVFAGDLLVLGSTVFIPASHEGNLADYLRSLMRLRSLNPRRAWPSHGPVIDDPAAVIEYYLEHRRTREEQVLGALESGLSLVEAITARIYPGVAAAVVPMASETVLAHLQKLEDDGLAIRDGANWAISR